MSFTPPGEQIETERLTLEPLRIAHAAEMTEVLADNELYHFTGGEAPSFEALNRRYTLLYAGSREDTEQWHNWIVRHQESGQAIGTVQATVTDMGADLAWTIGLASQGQGYAQEAALAMRDWLGSQGVRWFWAWIHPEHLASHTVARSLGLDMTTRYDEDGEQHWGARKPWG